MRHFVGESITGSSLAIRVIDASHHRVMPWKNGLGSTTEIAIDPPDADLAASFRWRLSIASVQSSGPFSAFPGYERTIMVIEGRGMDLAVGAAPARRLDRLFEPFVFSGDAPAECRLVGGPIRDFNLMVDRSRLRSRLDVLELDPAVPVDLPAVHQRVIHCFDGAIELTGDGSEGPLHLAMNHTAILDRVESSEGGVQVVAASASGAVIAVIGLTPHRPAA